MSPKRQSPQDSDHGWWQRIFAHFQSIRRGWVCRLQDRLFTELLADEIVKRQLIAFMDAAVTLRDSRLIAELIRVYFPRATTEVPGLVGILLKIGTFSGLPARLRGLGFRAAIKFMVGRFLAGRTIEEALSRVADLQGSAFLTSIDVVKERVVSRQEADAYRDRVLRLMDCWASHYRGPAMTSGAVPVRHISLKLSALTHRFDPLASEQVRDEAGTRLLEIFQRAKEHAVHGHPVLVNVDAEEFYVRDLSYDLFWEVFTNPRLDGWEDAGLVIQAYFKDAEQVLRQQMARARASKKRPQLRLVKGAYHRFEQIAALRRHWEIPVFLEQAQTDQNFRLLLKIACEHHELFRLAIGSHNLWDIACAQEVRESYNLDVKAFEVQVLLGVGDSLAAATVGCGIPSRVYAPFGTDPEAIGYLVRRLAEVGPDSAMAKMYQRKSLHFGSLGGSCRPACLRAATKRSVSKARRPPPAASDPGRILLEPEPDFSRREVRDAMRQAIDDVLGAKEKRIVRPMIDLVAGHARDSLGLEPILNPADIAKPVGQVRFATDSEVDEALAAAQEGFAEWSLFTPSDRADVMETAADLVIQRQYEIAATVIAEAGKPWDMALAETREAANFLRIYAHDAMREAKHYDPRGVGVSISPFNFPFAITMGQLAAGLALGNAMISKPAEQAPLSGVLAVEILREAGIPYRAIQLLPGRGESVGESLVVSPLVDFVAFTGSERTAWTILKRAAHHPPERRDIKLVVAESGGKNALIIDETADLDVAVSAVLEGAFHYNGQRCSAVSRVIVHESLREHFLKRLIAGVQSLVIGDPRDPATQMGYQIDEAALQKVHKYIELGKQEACLIYAADVSEFANHGYYCGPHIFANVRPDARIAQDEIFGPVLSVIQARSFAEALHIANNSRYGLTAALISRHPGHIQEFFEQMEAGNKYINRAPVGARPGETPFGGFKSSGTGPKAGGRDIVARFGVPKKKRFVVSSHWASPVDSAQDRSVDRHSFPLDQNRWSQKDTDRHATLRSRASLHSTSPLRVIQKQHSQKGRRSYVTLLGHVDHALEELLQGDKKVPLTREELIHAKHLIRHLAKKVDTYLIPHETIQLPGERNEVIFDYPLGISYIWSERECFCDMLAATLAALIMGNAVVLSPSTYESLIMQILTSANIPDGLIQTVRDLSPKELIVDKNYNFDFVVCHGPDAAEVHRRYFCENDERLMGRTSFPRFIGKVDDPGEARYLSYFAHATTLTERTLRHGADIDMRHVMNHSSDKLKKS